MPSAVTTRFAPSPTGRMHLGNARTALFNYLLARGRGGRYVLRVEDTDVERGDESYLQAQLEDLRWLGLEWDAGPGREDARGPYRQSARGELYEVHYRRLVESGVAYPCYCSPAELEVSRRTQLAAGRPPRYEGTCRGLDQAGRARQEAAGRRPTLRFRVPEGGRVAFEDLVRGPQDFSTDDIGDFVIRRADGLPVFFFCNALDDALMGITHVLRGEDHVANTPRQLLLLAELGFAAPSYGHLPLLLGADGAPLSKRRGSTSVGDLRAAGYLPEAVTNYLLRLGHAGAPDEWVPCAEQPTAFVLERVGRSPAHYDEVQLQHWQREAVKRLAPEALDAWLAPALPPGLDPARRRLLAATVSHNVLFPADAGPWVDVLFGELPPPGEEVEALLAEAGPGFFDAALAALPAAGADLPALAREIRQRTGRKGAALYMPLRAALTGRRDGPELGPIVEALGTDQLEKRFGAHAAPVEDKH
jgi:nondiscriminating glutamyl-tRNA synthetase